MRTSPVISEGARGVKIVQFYLLYDYVADRVVGFPRAVDTPPGIRPRRTVRRNGVTERERAVRLDRLRKRSELRTVRLPEVQRRHAVRGEPRAPLRYRRTLLRRHRTLGHRRRHRYIACHQQRKFFFPRFKLWTAV